MADRNTYLFEIAQGLKAQGHELDDDTLKELAKAVQHPQLMSQLQSGQVTTRQIVEEAMNGLQVVTSRRQPQVGQLGVR